MARLSRNTCCARQPWEKYIDNYRLIHATILSSDAHSAVIIFTAHIRWVLRNMRLDARVA